MKYFIFLLLCICNGLVLQSQIVIIPDAAFKSTLVANASINTNNDNEIQLAEAQAVFTLAIANNNIVSMEGIRSFSNLRSLSLSTRDLASLDIHDLNQLDSVMITADSLSNISLNGCNSLSLLEIYKSKLQQLDVRVLPLLNMMDISSSSTLSSINADNSPALRYFGLGPTTHVDSLLFRNCDSLMLLSISNGINRIGMLDLSGSDKIQTVTIQPHIKSLSANFCAALRNVSVFIGTTDFGGCDTLSLAGSTNINSVTLDNVTGKSYDFSYAPLLSYLRLHRNTQVNATLYLNLKNGTSLNTFDFSSDMSDSLRLCADDFEIAEIIAHFETMAQSTVPIYEISPYCTIGHYGNMNNFRGRILADADGNGCTTSDVPVPGIPVRITNTLTGNSTVRYTVQTGEFFHVAGAGNYSVTPYFAYPYFSIAPISQNIVFDTSNHLIDTADFCVTPTATINNLEVTFLPTNRSARPGFDADYRLLYRNRGTTTLSGNVQLSFDQTRMNLVSSTITPTTTLPGQLSWTFNNLRPFESAISDMVFNLLPPPVNNVGDTIIFLAAVNPVVGDNSPSDNSFILPQTIQGSFDPNDKQCLQGGQIDISKIGNDLYYLIRFQNKGTDTAFNVIVADTLTNHYNEETFDIVTASHPVNVKRTANKIEFLFQDIKLPHEAINEPASHGYIVYKVKPVNSLVIGDSLNNKASIYFDYNLPIVTNKATTIVSSLGPVPVRVEYFTGARKGMVNDLYWKAACSGNNSRFGIERSADGTRFESIGILSATDNRCLMPFSFTDASPLKGTNYYRLKITDENGLVHYSKTIQLQQLANGIEIINITAGELLSRVNIYSSGQKPVSMYLVGADGKILGYTSTVLNTGNNQLPFNHSYLTAGVYALLLYTNTGNTIIKRFTR